MGFQELTNPWVWILRLGSKFLTEKTSRMIFCKVDGHDNSEKTSF